MANRALTCSHRQVEDVKLKECNYQIMNFYCQAKTGHEPNINGMPNEEPFQFLEA